MRPISGTKLKPHKKTIITIKMENPNMFNSFADMQKKAVEQFTQAAENMKNAMLNANGVDFNSEFFKKWYDSQMSWFNKHQDGSNNQAFDFFRNWMNAQTDIARQWFDMSQGMMKTMPMPGMENMNWNNQYSNMMNMFNSWKDSMNTAYTDMLSQFSNGTNKETFSGMFNNAEMYMKMFQFWMPMMKSLQDKTFTPEMFRSMFNAPAYKEMMDNMFNMQPDFMKNFYNQSLDMMKNNGGNMMDMGKNMFDQMKGNMNNAMNQFMPANMFTAMLDSYNNWYTQMHQAAAPMARLVANGPAKQSAEAMQELMNHMNIYQLKNAQMQYMMYTTGMKAMDEMAESLYTRMRNGEEFTNFMKVYQEWLNNNDKHFVNLFQSDEYSKLMSEVSALQLGLKKKIENQMEKALSNLPLINRTEMDELYQTIQTLKNRINQLEKQIDMETDSTEAKEAKPRKASKANA